MAFQITRGREKLPALLAKELEAVAAGDGEFEVGGAVEGRTYRNHPVTLYRLDRIINAVRPRLPNHFFVAVSDDGIAAIKQLHYETSGLILKAQLWLGDQRHVDFVVKPSGRGIGGMLSAEAINHVVTRNKADGIPVAIFLPNVENPQWAQFHRRIGMTSGPDGLHVPAEGLAEFASREGPTGYKHYLLRRA
ncbi:hypothetical protein AUJ14_05795 [Candidatus Micrarchaeota archaeon CG1_02_55_22]|nr:MAG: hypothetical protein AUJ14_05795 [Candidatus Micrarchaeota archaeon CG1_02_55_22]